jgi:hypothetical protein
VSLSRALSSKTRKSGLPHLTIEKIDHLDNYDVEIDKLDRPLEKAFGAWNHEDLPSDAAEKAHYMPLTAFLNACLDACRGFYHKSFYKDLKFIVFDTQTQDGILGAHPLKPDISGADGLLEKNKRLWWRPESRKRHQRWRLP